MDHGTAEMRDHADMRLRLFRFTPLLFTLPIAGCIAVPISVPEEKPFKDIVEGSIIIGETTAQDVTDVLGKPDIENGQYWLYRDWRRGWQWAWCAGIPNFGADCGALPRSINNYFLEVQLDSDEVVTGARLYSESELCSEKRICFEDNILMRAAPIEDDAAAKLFKAPSGGCSVYTYSTSEADSASGELDIDGTAVGGLVGASGYYLHAVSPGPHVWAIAPTVQKSIPYQVAISRFDCKNGRIVFLKYSLRLRPKLERVDSERGKKEVLERWLANTAPENVESNYSNWLRGGEIYVTMRDNTVAVYEIKNSDGPSSWSNLTKWGVTDSGEPCGIRVALEDYDLSPIGDNNPGLQVGESLRSPVQLRAVCNTDGSCAIESIIDGRSCEADGGTEIEFGLYSKLLVIEPHGDSHNEVFFGKAKSLKKNAACKSGVCRIDVAHLRKIVSQIGDAGALE